MTSPMVIIEGRGPAVVSTIYCIGRNYADHAKELNNPVPQGEPVVFLKAPASLRTLEQGALAFASDTFHHEAELVLRVGQLVPLGHSADWDVVDAIGLGLDLTRRTVQGELKTKGLPWTTAKSFAGSALVSPMLSVTDIGGRVEFGFKLTVNGESRQQGHTRNMLFPVPAIVQYLASFNTLLPGDLIFTGTPAGVGPIQRGDAFTLELDEPHRIWHGRL